MDSPNSKYHIRWEAHPKQVFKQLCSLKEHQSLVDVALVCGSNVLHAHKSILAANSVYFREHFEASNIQQVNINGIDFSVMKSLVEFMYCGETTVAEVHAKCFIAATKLFQLRILEGIFEEANESLKSAEDIYIPPPQFLCKSPKYSTTIKPPNQIRSESAMKNQYKNKFKVLSLEAEKACDIEAQASANALNILHNSLANKAPVNSFIVEESFTETTIENFIPHDDQNFSFIPEGNPIIPQSNNNVNLNNNDESVAKRNKKIVVEDVEILLGTSDGNFVDLSDEIQNFPKGSYQYQIVDENGHLGEIQDLHVLDYESIQKPQNELDETTRISSADVNNISKTLPDKLLDPKFRCFDPKMKKLPSFDPTKDHNDDAALMCSSIDDRLYDNRIPRSCSEISEPENLIVRNNIVVSSNSFEMVDTINHVNKLSATNNCNGFHDLNEIGGKENLKTNSESSQLTKNSDMELSNKEILNPDIFFYDLTKDEENKVSSNGDNNNNN